jgi:mono/diheme cytochrome c family protein
MDWGLGREDRRGAAWASTAFFAATLVATALGGCGGGGNDLDSGPDKTTLTVQASDAEGDALTYQWRVTAGTINNVNAAQTTWILPAGGGLHFAYVMISDGKGGYVQQQYAVSSDSLDQPAPTRAPLTPFTPTINDINGTQTRLRFVAGDPTAFTPPAGGAAQARLVYRPDMPVQVTRDADGLTIFSGLTDLGGEVDLPKLDPTAAYTVLCASSQDVPPSTCGHFTPGPLAAVLSFSPVLGPARNLRLFGHVQLSDGGTCGTQDEFFGVQSAATVQLQRPDGTALGSVQRVNRFGDYALDASVGVHDALKLEVRCEGYSRTLDVPVSPDPAGYVATAPIEVSHQVANSRPQVLKMVGNGLGGNVRGEMVQLTQPTAQSNTLPGPLRFLTFKGKDTRMSACLYYRALGYVRDCDAQGNLVDALTLDDWKRAKQFAPYTNGNVEVAANYINKFDLNLVRRMVATQTGPNAIAFYVCNSPGPFGTTQTEIDRVISDGLAGDNEVACVAMEWSVTTGVNNDQPFTKFLTFAPDGTLIPSINLDGRGEKFMPGACVACHGGNQYNGRFPESGQPSPYLGSGFLPFDTGNYLFSSNPTLSEATQGKSFHNLNLLAKATENNGNTAVSTLVAGWYASGTDTLDKSYVPPVWQAADANPATAGAARFYREVVGASCRTCHVSLGASHDWDSILLSPARAQAYACGGTSDIVINAAMPNALMSRDGVASRVAADPTLAALMRTFLGCDAPQPDPVYPQR